MATEPADVLIIGAGASGGVVALRLAEAGFSVVCLEQGGWLDRADYPGNKLDWELKARKDWATSPNIRGLAQDYPIVEDDTPGLAADVQRASAGRRSSSPAPGPARCRPTSASARSTGSPTTGRSTTSSCCPTSIGPTASSACPACPAIRPTRPTREDAPMPPLPIGRGRDEDRPRAHQARLALVARVQLDQFGRRTTAAGRASSAAPASRAATKAPRPRPT